jgi:hypothetical protein
MTGLQWSDSDLNGQTHARKISEASHRKRTLARLTAQDPVPQKALLVVSDACRHDRKIAEKTTLLAF